MPSGEWAKVRPHLALFHTDNNSNRPSVSTKDSCDLCILYVPRIKSFFHRTQPNCFSCWCIDYMCKCCAVGFVTRSLAVSVCLRAIGLLTTAILKGTQQHVLKHFQEWVHDSDRQVECFSFFVIQHGNLPICIHYMIPDRARLHDVARCSCI